MATPDVQKQVVVMLEKPKPIIKSPPVVVAAPRAQCGCGGNCMCGESLDNV